MIEQVRSAGIYVSDQDRALAFWTERVGFELVQDTPIGPEPDAPRWIEVRPPGGGPVLVLFTPEEQKDRVGSFSNVIFRCGDVQRTSEELSSRGVEFADEPREELWGWWAAFRDPDGNTYGLGQ